MATAPFVIERKVQYHGIWNTGLQVTDQFIKNIAQQHDTKPSCPTFITLSVNSISLVVLTRNGEKELRRDHIAFDVLREIAVNAYNPKCLMILYINSKNKFSVIVCSCQDSSQAMNISLAYKQLKNYRLLNPNKVNHAIQNWTLQKSTRDVNDEDSVSTRSRTESGVMNDTFAFLGGEEDSLAGDDDDVFGSLEAVEREPVSGDDVNSEAFHAGLQVNLEDRSHRGGSVSSRSSIVSFKSITDEISIIENGLDPESPGIGQSEFFKRDSVEETTEKTQENGLDNEENDKEENGNENGDENGNDNSDENDEDNANKSTIAKFELVKIDDSEKYDYRSVATQTVAGSILTKRYKKREGSKQGSSNIYRDMAASRKSSKDNSSSSINTSTNGMDAQRASDMAVLSASSSLNGSIVRSRASSFNSGVSYKSLFMPRQVQTSSSSVSRPIEDVYRSWSRSKRAEVPGRSRRVIVYTQQRK